MSSPLTAEELRSLALSTQGPMRIIEETASDRSKNLCKTERIDPEPDDRSVGTAHALSESFRYSDVSRSQLFPGDTQNQSTESSTQAEEEKKARKRALKAEEREMIAYQKDVNERVANPRRLDAWINAINQAKAGRTFHKQTPTSPPSAGRK